MEDKTKIIGSERKGTGRFDPNLAGVLNREAEREAKLEKRNKALEDRVLEKAESQTLAPNDKLPKGLYIATRGYHDSTIWHWI